MPYVRWSYRIIYYIKKVVIVKGNNLKVRGVLEAYFYFIIFKIFISLASKEKVEKYIKLKGKIIPQNIDIGAYRKARNVRLAIASASKYVWWNSNNRCLLDALVAKKMMVRRKLPVTVHMGLKKNKKGQLVPHAWTKCGYYFVTGVNRGNFDSRRKFAASE